MTSMLQMLSTRRRAAVPWLAATVALAAFIASRLIAPIAADARPWALAATDLAETSGTTCGATWSEFFELPNDLENQASSKRGWILQDKVFSGSLQDMATATSGRVFGTGQDAKAFVNGDLRGEQVSLELLRAATKAEAWIVTSITRSIACD